MQPFTSCFLLGVVLFSPTLADDASPRQKPQNTDSAVARVHRQHQLLGASLAADALRSTGADSPPQPKTQFALTASRFVNRHQAPVAAITRERDDTVFDRVKSIQQINENATAARADVADRLAAVESAIERTRQGNVVSPWRIGDKSDNTWTSGPATDRVLRFDIPKFLDSESLQQLANLQAQRSVLKWEERSLSAKTLGWVKQDGFLRYLAAVVEQDIAVIELKDSLDTDSTEFSRPRLERLRATAAKIDTAMERVSDAIQANTANTRDDTIESLVDNCSGVTLD